MIKYGLIDTYWALKISSSTSNGNGPTEADMESKPENKPTSSDYSVESENGWWDWNQGKQEWQFKPRKTGSSSTASSPQVSPHGGGGSSGRLPLGQVVNQIRKGGIETFKKIIKNPNYGPDMFIRSISNWSTNNSDGLPELWSFSLKAASWGHHFFPDPDDELRHIVVSFLLTEKFGLHGARQITNLNEAYGFVRFDIPNFPNRLEGGNWAFELEDLINNSKGRDLWIKYSLWKNGMGNF